MGINVENQIDKFVQKVCFEWCIIRDNLQKIIDGTKKQEACSWWLSFIEEVIIYILHILLCSI